ncbi:DUF3991 and TOPRIM domain-containing protein [Faecalicatena contorta]|uniref:DUF3991 domain-containing protein n=1 Tax=Faecalicatena contorta TaxID=39482 RepID=A0A316ADF4_9FIRM|nr:DUF3991 and TOPRIM domain-containing protein [Faecalicatena contorta]PWJ47807.1 uncharacterized protein DUF3991 [Faecalicatena contorta]SUQ15801.1 Protein of unknown function [Faecalicatena contorta]
MPYIAPEVVRQAKRMDLLTYLKSYEPYELVHFSGNTYTTKTHDSLKVSNGKWMWWSRGIGGRSALDYLIKVKGYTFMQAVQIIVEQAAIQPPISVPKEGTKEKILLLPKPYRYQEYVISYLQRRGIDMAMIEFCLQTGRIFETEYHHNAVFVGRDKDDKPRYAALRGIGTDFIGEASGSDKNYSFSIPAEGKSQRVHLFESVIDLLSYATLQKLEGENWRAEHLLSLAGIYQPAKEIEKSKVPAALTRFLKEHTGVREVVLHLDNDRVGRLATKAIQTVLPTQYHTEDQPPSQGNDYNDCLCIRLGVELTKRAKNSERRYER